jgi:tRNA (guanine-N7-)-methyltransferase
LVQPEWLDTVVSKCQSGAVIHAATDWEPYAEHMMSVFSAHPQLTNLAGEGKYSPRPASRPITKFELRGHRLGHNSYDLIFSRR